MDQKSSGKESNTKPDINEDKPGECSLPKRTDPFPELPAKMIIAIDGWAQSGKNTAGELVAKHLGGVLVDSGRFYRAMTMACLQADVDFGNRDKVAAWSKRVALDVRLANEGGMAEEAQVAINGRWFTKDELKQVGLQTSLMAAIPEVRALVNTTLRLCDCYGRVVVLGRDISGVVFPDTPYKFFLDATEEIREKRHIKNMNHPGAKKRDIYDQSRVIFTEDSLMIDTSKLEPAEVSGIILVEVFWRASSENASKEN
jgi:cytidylate kinase